MSGLSGLSGLSGNPGIFNGQVAAAPFVGAYDAIASLVHVYEPARRTLSAYTGNLVKLRRASDDAESDFTYVSDADPELNLASIAAWAGGASYIVSVYDQVNGDTITQATAGDQPLFVASCRNGHAGGRLDGTNHYLQGAFTNGGALSQPFSVYATMVLDAAAVDDGFTRYLLDGDDVTNRVLSGTRPTITPDAWTIWAGAYLVGGNTDAAWNVWATLYNGASSQFWHNTVAECVAGNAGANNIDGLTFGASYLGSTTWDGDIAMLAIADPSHTDEQRGAMETAINAYWGVY